MQQYTAAQASDPRRLHLPIGDMQVIRSDDDVALYTLTEEELQRRIEQCSTCRGIGYQRDRSIQPGQPGFGTLFPCPRCAPILREQRRRLRGGLLAPVIEEYSTLVGELLTRTFTGYDADVAGVRAGYNAAIRWVHRAAGESDEGLPWLYLWGPVGSGKTHLAASAANYLRERRVPVVMTTMPSLLGMIRGMSRWEDKETLLVHLGNVPVLVVDDVGVENRTGWTEENLYRIVDTRYNLRVPTLIVSNCAPADLGDKRVASRVLDTEVGVVVPVKAEDYRRGRK